MTEIERRQHDPLRRVALLTATNTVLLLAATIMLLILVVG